MERRINMLISKNVLMLLWMFLVPCQLEQDFRTICLDDVCTCDGYGRVICHCTQDYQEITIRPDGAYKMLSTATHIHIDNCQRVSFLPNAVTNLQELRSIKISNVERLSLSENSLNWAGYSHGNQMIYPGVNIEIQNTTVSNIPSQCVKGHIDEVLINASSILNIRPFAFSNLIGTKKIDIINSYFPNIENQAFKKVSLDYLLISGSYFKLLPSRTFSDLEVTKSFRIFNTTMDKIRSSAFIITGTKKTQIDSCHIGTIEVEALKIVTRGSVGIRNNIIDQMDAGALAGIGVSKEVTSVTGKSELLFENNAVILYEKDSWKVNQTSFEIVIKQLKINKSCDCDNTNYMLPLLFDEGNVWCIYKNSSGQTDYTNLKIFNDEICSSNSVNKIVVVSIVVSVCVIIGAIAVIIVFIVKQRKRRQVAWVNGVKPKDKGGPQLPIILPDGRTYRETELHVIIEKAQLLTTDL